MEKINNKNNEFLELNLIETDLVLSRTEGDIFTPLVEVEFNQEDADTYFEETALSLKDAEESNLDLVLSEEEGE